jgi:hypothetical protein
VEVYQLTHPSLTAEAFLKISLVIQKHHMTTLLQLGREGRGDATSLSRPIN